jgi:hypothetical protein
MIFSLSVTYRLKPARVELRRCAAGRMERRFACANAAIEIVSSIKDDIAIVATPA